MCCYRAELGEDGLEKAEVKEELSKSRKQIETSRLKLTQLRDHGFDFVTSVRVAGDGRENARRLEEEEAKRARKEKLDQEAKAGQERFEEVSSERNISARLEISNTIRYSLTLLAQFCGTEMVTITS